MTESMCENYEKLANDAHKKQEIAMHYLPFRTYYVHQVKIITPYEFKHEIAGMIKVHLRNNIISKMSDLYNTPEILDKVPYKMPYINNYLVKALKAAISEYPQLDGYKCKVELHTTEDRMLGIYPSILAPIKDSDLAVKKVKEFKPVNMTAPPFDFSNLAINESFYESIAGYAINSIVNAFKQTSSYNSIGRNSVNIVDGTLEVKLVPMDYVVTIKINKSIAMNYDHNRFQAVFFEELGKRCSGYDHAEVSASFRDIDEESTDCALDLNIKIVR